MSWLAFSILAYLVIGIQTGVGAFMRLGPAEPNLGVLAVVFICINAQRESALLACFALGAVQDLATQQPFGLFAFSYGLAALAISSIAQAVYREHPLTHFSCTVLAAGLTALVLALHGRVHHLPIAAGRSFWVILYTAALGIFLIGLLQRLKRLFMFRK